MAIEADISQLPLDEQLLAVLPGKLQEEWQKLRPEGLIDASIQLRYDGRAWQPQVRIKCQNVSFAHYKFPYRLEHGNGLLELKDDRLQMNLSTFSENQLVHIVGEVRNPTNGPTGWLQVDERGVAHRREVAQGPAAAGPVAGPFDGSERNHRLQVRAFPRHPRRARASASSAFGPAAAGCATISFPMPSRMFAAKWK